MEIDTSKLSISNLIERFFNLEIVGEWIHFLPKALLTTLELVAAAGVVGVFLGICLALATVSRHAAVRGVARSYIEAFRGTSVLVQLLFIYFGLPLIGIRLEPFVAGALALALNSAAYVAEIFRAGLESVPRGQFEAARSLGMSYRKALRVVVLPQSFRRVMPPMTNELIALIKDSALVSVIGVSEILRLAQVSMGATFNASMYTVAALTYLLMTIPLGILARRLERRFGEHGSESWIDSERLRRRERRQRRRGTPAPLQTVVDGR